MARQKLIDAVVLERQRDLAAAVEISHDIDAGHAPGVEIEPAFENVPATPEMQFFHSPPTFTVLYATQFTRIRRSLVISISPASH